jgi:hypothetical protein
VGYVFTIAVAMSKLAAWCEWPKPGQMLPAKNVVQLAHADQAGGFVPCVTYMKLSIKQGKQTMIDNQTVELIVALAQEVEVTDPIDWGMLAIDEEEAYRMMAISILETFPDESITIQSVLTKLTVENFVLNLKLAQR